MAIPDNTRTLIRLMRDPQLFQEIVESLLQEEYGTNFRATDADRDKGIDGRIVSENAIIQCFCPRKPERLTNKKVKEKIRVDMRKVARYGPARWIFITPFNLLP